MSAAATAAGYLYASGRLHGRAGKEESQKDEGTQRKKVRVAALPETERPDPAPAPQQPKRTPTIQYRTRRWRPDV